MAMRILPATRREAMFALYGFCRAVDDIADERGPATASQRLAELDALARRRRRDVCRPRAAASRRPRPRRGGTSISSRRISTPSSTAWRWTPRGHPRPRLGDARPLLRPGRERRRPAFGAHLRPRARTRRGAGPPSRARASADQHSARHRRGRGRRPALPAARGARRRRRDDRRAVSRRRPTRSSPAPASRWRRARARISRSPIRSWRRRRGRRSGRRA